MLREKKYEAYEFHDRQTSIVCVGSFDAIGPRGRMGKSKSTPPFIKS